MKFVLNESERNQGVSRREDTSWEVRKNLFDFFAFENWSIGTCAQHRQAGYRISDDPALMRTLFEWRWDDASRLDFGIEGITGANTQPAPNRTGKHDLTFGGNSGLHGKTILPRVPSRRNFPWALIASSYLS
jgi:hypothetical protein